MRSEGYWSWFVCVCVCVSVCLSVFPLLFWLWGSLWAIQVASKQQDVENYKDDFSVQEIWRGNKRIKPIHAVYTTRWTYWLYAKIRRFSTHRYLYNCFLRKLECFSLIFGFLAFTVYSYYILIAHARALTWCTHDNLVRGTPTQKYILETLCELRHTVDNDSSLLVTALSRGVL